MLGYGFVKPTVEEKREEERKGDEDPPEIRFGPLGNQQLDSAEEEQTVDEVILPAEHTQTEPLTDYLLTSQLVVNHVVWDGRRGFHGNLLLRKDRTLVASAALEVGDEVEDLVLREC